eukprot:29119-Pelagococcus_subviridis.AAC.3
MRLERRRLAREDVERARLRDEPALSRALTQLRGELAASDRQRDVRGRARRGREPSRDARGERRGVRRVVEQVASEDAVEDVVVGESRERRQPRVVAADALVHEVRRRSGRRSGAVVVGVQARHVVPPVEKRDAHGFFFGCFFRRLRLSLLGGGFERRGAALERLQRARRALGQHHLPRAARGGGEAAQPAPGAELEHAPPARVDQPAVCVFFSLLLDAVAARRVDRVREHPRRAPYPPREPGVVPRRLVDVHVDARASQPHALHPRRARRRRAAHLRPADGEQLDRRAAVVSAVASRARGDRVADELRERVVAVSYRAVERAQEDGLRAVRAREDRRARVRGDASAQEDEIRAAASGRGGVVGVRAAAMRRGRRDGQVVHERLELAERVAARALVVVDEDLAHDGVVGGHRGGARARERNECAGTGDERAAHVRSTRQDVMRLEEQ